jgi:hypothetical protein
MKNSQSNNNEKEFSWQKETRPTIGQMLADTQEEHQKQQIEVGEITEEIGNKEVLKEIWKQIHDRSGLPQWKDKFYLVVFYTKNPILHRIIEVNVQSRHSRCLPEPGLTLFSYDPALGDQGLKLEWVLPNKHAFKTFLMTPTTTDPFLMDCIKKYQAGTLV